MARCAFGPLIAPLLVGACVATTVPSARTAFDAPPAAQVLHEPADARDEAPPADDERIGIAIGSEPAAVSLHAVEDKVETKTVAAVPFTRTIDRARVEARGASRIDAIVDSVVLREAATLDNGAWRGDQRRELLAYLRGQADKDAKFTEADARTVAQLQAGSGAMIHGVLTDETMAVLFAMGFRFSFRKMTASDVTLEFYPGDIEDLDAWTREFDAKVTTKGGGFHEVDAPDGEGTIYVYVGSSIVASYRARGGPPYALDDDGEHIALPTTPGVYRLGPAHPHVSRNWYYSQIPWGAEIRQNEDGYQYRWAGRARWLWATPHAKAALKDPLDFEDFEDLPEVTRDGSTYWIWNKNDFGPIAWNLGPSDLYVHTTPHTEAQYADGEPTTLGVSHGCIHIDPRERDEMMKRGYLGKNVTFIVRRWEEHLLPDEIRHDILDRAAISASRESSSRESQEVCRAETTSASAACSQEASR